MLMSGGLLSFCFFLLWFCWWYDFVCRVIVRAVDGDAHGVVTSAIRSPIHFMTGTAMLLPIALY
jgi:hypothetical protein